MNTDLDHRSYAYHDEDDVVTQIKRLAERLDQKHPLERKVQFLLDIRGFLYLNQLKGDYIEFGSFKSEMQFAAYHILDATHTIEKYIGLDTFEGEPSPDETERRSLPIMAQGDFQSDHTRTKAFVDATMHGKGVIIKGDFRQASVLGKCDQYGPFSIAVVDCNLMTSLEASIHYSLQHLIDGGVLFVDDYFTNLGEGIPRIPDLLERSAKEAGRRLIPHKTYPPFARSFIVTR